MISANYDQIKFWISQPLSKLRRQDKKNYIRKQIPQFTKFLVDIKLSYLNKKRWAATIAGIR